MFGRLFAMTLGTTALFAVVIMITLLVANRASVEDVPFKKQFMCYFEIEGTCLEPRVQALRAEREQIRQDMARLEAEAKALAGGDAVNSNSGDLGGWYVRVSAIYADTKNKTGLKAALCHAARDIGGPDHSLLIARLVDGKIEREPVDHRFARQLNFSADDIEKGLASCPWPSLS